MKVGVTSYPMLFQNEGGLQVQVMESINQLRILGVDIALLDVTRDKLADYDIIHVFAVTQGNYKIVEQARAKGCIVVVSGLLNRALVPSGPTALHAVRLLGRVLGRLSAYTVSTTYETTSKALAGAHHVIALSDWERTTIGDAYGVPADRISMIPNGVSDHFQAGATDSPLASNLADQRFVFCPGKISPWKNQKMLVEALVGTDLTVVLAGPVAEQEQGYLEACMNVPGARVRYLGNLDRHSPELMFCFTRAAAVVLPSRSESGPLVALEALAAGTPAIITRHNGLDMAADGACLSFVDPSDKEALLKTVLQVLAAPPEPGRCRQRVADRSWGQVARQIRKVYEAQMTARASA